MQQTTPEPSFQTQPWLRLLPSLRLLALLGLFVACDQKSSGPAPAPSLDAGQTVDAGLDAASTASVCEPAGAFRCNPEQPAVLEVCDPETVLGWTEYLRCAAPQLCDADRGECLSCEPGASRCDGWRLQRCDATGSHWELQAECHTEDHCNSTEERCLHCLGGQGFCADANFVSCNANQDGLEAITCESADLCNVASMGCRQCFPDEYQCSGNDLMRCDEEHTWQRQDTCETEFLCSKTLEVLADDAQASAECLAPVCEAGEFRCNPDNPAVLQGCPPSRDRFETIDVCGQPAQCNAEQGKCDAGCGVPGAYRCNGAALQRCDADGFEWVTEQVCNTAPECNAQKRDCEVCETGDWQCNDNVLQRCDDDQRWITEEICASARLCHVDSESSEQACQTGCGTPGAFRCNSRQLEECSADASSWEVREHCASEALCDPTDGRCVPVRCPSAGLLTCRGQELRRCRDELTGWDVLTSCAEGTLCDIASMGCVDTCTVPDYRCNGAQPEHCVEGSEGPGWEASEAPCAAFGLCVADDEGSRCLEPVCGGSLPDYRCDGSDAQECNQARTGWGLALSCPANTSCDVGSDGEGPPQCDVCAANSFSCAANGSLRRCSADGQTLTTVQPCRDREHCVVEDDGTSGFCYVCEAGDTRCNGGNLERCGEDRRSWEPEQTCDPVNGCQDNPGYNDRCNACPAPGQTSCSGDNQLRTCSDDQQSWTSPVSCQYGCQESAEQDYCRDCSPNTAQCSPNDAEERRVCDPSGRWGDYVECPNDGECIDDGDTDRCGTCTPNTFTCVTANERQGCSSSGQPGAITACPQDTPVCLDGDCVACSPGEPAICPGGVGSQDRRICNEEGQWEPAVCPSPNSVCHQGNCVACLPGTTRCLGGSVSNREVCDVNGSWTTANCIDAERSVCLDGECVQCDPSSTQPRCTGNATLQSCGSDGEWDTQDCVGGTPVCFNGMCRACNPETQSARCAPGQAGVLEVCRAGSWVSESCDEATPVCTGDGQCVCSNGDYRCGSSGVRQQCVGQVWIDTPCNDGYCTEGGSCVECLNDNTCPSDLPECVGGQCECEDGTERCSDGAHQVCDDGAWRTEACAGDTPVCDDVSGRCVCQEGAERCEDGVRQTCDDLQWVNEDGEPACTACTGAGDCGGTTPICDGVVCVACSADSCPSGLVCASTGACVECTSSNLTSCSSSAPACSSSNECVQCTSSSDDLCTGTTPVCEDNVCRGCASDQDCPGAACADNGACVECTASDADDCPAATPACSSSNQCVQCSASDDSLCTGATPVCDTESNTCVGCVDSDDCSGDSPSCDTELGACVGCLSDADCDGSVCDQDARECVECVDTQDCSGTEVCDTQVNECVQCLDDGDCSDAAAPVCNTATNSCGACTDGDLCPNEQVCVNEVCTACQQPTDAGSGVACPDGFSCSAEGTCES